ncbi:hypothetical protein E2C01_049556 [Portunus trituberculatus]|uniref:Uncharacterized protein n=1 Tax=Portunus trituberculatus TaxID=210409 RepID=A0A5B7GE89_PORTR|nr:hypothetical protein [Portunus trituberculatus]
MLGKFHSTSKAAVCHYHRHLTGCCMLPPLLSCRVSSVNSVVDAPRQCCSAYLLFCIKAAQLWCCTLNKQEYLFVFIRPVEAQDNV